MSLWKFFVLCVVAGTLIARPVMGIYGTGWLLDHTEALPAGLIAGAVAAGVAYQTPPQTRKSSTYLWALVAGAVAIAIPAMGGAYLDG